MANVTVNYKRHKADVNWLQENTSFVKVIFKKGYVSNVFQTLKKNNFKLGYIKHSVLMNICYCQFLVQNCYAYN